MISGRVGWMAMLIAVSTVSRDPRERAIAVVLQAGELAADKRPTWWQWTTWLSVGMTIWRIQIA